MTELPPAPDRPALRHLEVHRLDRERDPGIVLVDPLELCEGHVFVPEPLLPVVSRFDGRHSIEEIERILSGELGEPVPAGFVARLVRQFDEALLLHSPRFLAALDDAARAFAALPARPSSHAGRSAGYPDEAEPCRVALAAIVRAPDGAERAPLGGLIAPHIDLDRGRDGYRAAYERLARSEPRDLYVVFGTGHQGPGASVTGLALDWQTPVGTLRTDREFVARVHEHIGAPPDPLDVYLHRREHSIEFQMLFLAHVLAGADCEVAGFLTGALPEDRGERQRIVEAFAEVAHASGKRVCWIAGADLAHLGPQFGDAAPIGPAELARLDRDERRKLAHLEREDPHAFWDSVQAAGNRDRVCGTTPITLVAALAGGPGELLHYGQAHADDGSQVVSFCAMGFAG